MELVALLELELEELEELDELLVVGPGLTEPPQPVSDAMTREVNRAAEPRSSALSFGL